MALSGDNAKLSVDKIIGDSSGILTVRPTQQVHMKGSEGHLPFSVLSQKGKEERWLRIFIFTHSDWLLKLGISCDIHWFAK